MTHMAIRGSMGLLVLAAVASTSWSGATPAHPPDAVAKLSYDGTATSCRSIAEAALPAARQGNILALCIARQAWLAAGDDHRLDRLPYSLEKDVGKEALATWQKMINDKAAKGDTFYLNVLGTQYLFGYNVPKDEARGMKVWEDLAAKGDGFASQKLAALIHTSGDHAPERIKRMLAYEEKAAEKGMPGAIYNLGCYYYEGRYLERDYKKAFDYFSKAAAAGHAVAARNLGICYLQGQGVQTNSARAQMWFERAEDAGDDGAISWLNEHFPPVTIRTHGDDD